MASKLPKNKLHTQGTTMDNQTNEIQNTPVSPVITIETKIGRIDEGVGALSGSNIAAITGKLPFDKLPDELSLQREKDLVHQFNINTALAGRVNANDEDLKEYKLKTDNTLTSHTTFITGLQNLSSEFEIEINALDTSLNVVKSDVGKTREDMATLFELARGHQNVIEAHHNNLKRQNKLLWLTIVIAYGAFFGVLFLHFSR